MESETTRFLHRARTPRAAAVAGILFSILFSCAMVLVLLVLPADFADPAAWTEQGRSFVSVSMGLMPLAGLAFLWFIGVVRDRLGPYEDQFFAEVFQGSGLLFLAMAFAAFAVGAGMLVAYRIGGSQAITPEIYVVGRSVMSQLFSIYALKMAAVFIFSLSTLWLRTGVMPRWLCFGSYAVALLMFLSISLSLWMVLVFPVWVLAVSGYFLVMSYRRPSFEDADGAPPRPATG